MPERTKQGADLDWLATLLTGSHETANGLTSQTIGLAGEGNAFFSSWIVAWSRRLVIARALAAVREDLRASARRTALRPADSSALPPKSWSLDPGTTKSDLERALLSIDVFPRAAVLLSIFERVPLKDVAVLLDAEPELVRKAQAAGVRELDDQPREDAELEIRCDQVKPGD